MELKKQNSSCLIWTEPRQEYGSTMWQWQAKLWADEIGIPAIEHRSMTAEHFETFLQESPSSFLVRVNKTHLTLPNLCDAITVTLDKNPHDISFLKGRKLFQDLICYNSATLLLILFCSFHVVWWKSIKCMLTFTQQAAFNLPYKRVESVDGGSELFKTPSYCHTVAVERLLAVLITADFIVVC